MSIRICKTILAIAGTAAGGILLLGAWNTARAAQSGAVRANTLVTAAAYVSLAPVPRGRTFEIAVVLKVREQFHINAHEVSEEYLIPTEINAALPAGFRVLGTTYSKGTLHTFSFSPKPLNVYQGSVTLRIKVEALGDAPLGAQTLPLKLHYQACSEDTCYPPVTIPVTAELEIVPRGAAAHPAHTEIFSSKNR